MKNSIYVQVALVAIILIVPNLLHAQPVFTDDVVDAPVDGGLSLLIAGGIGYGIKKVREKRKNNY
ncbi:MAG: hypothetical protein C0459_01400 [Chitinophaga sp.]|jgi:hypothetical protein|nr:hypothetical protein [Chitinophaga sp.]